MANANEHQKAPDDSFGAHLARLRSAAGLTLRQVEEATNGDISNAYLSQLENNKIAKPSPHILHVLAGVYVASYEDLMKRAGYFMSDTNLAGPRRGKAATFAIQNLTREEETILIDYLAFIRKQKRK